MMFAVGFYMPITELRLLSYGVSENEVGYWFSLGTVAYALSSLAVSFIPEQINKSSLMLFGTVLQFFAFMLMGPCPWLFPESLAITATGFFVLGVACGFMFVPSVPHMMQLARNKYGFAEDHRLNDALSSIASMSLSIGEITGPIVATVLYDMFGYAVAAEIVGFVFGTYAIVYAVFSDAIVRKVKVISKNAEDALVEKSSVVEEKSS
jgi:MFS family permease